MGLKTIKLVEFILQQGVSVYVPVRSDYIDYFNIPEATASTTTTLKSRAAHTRTVYPAGLGTGAAPKTINVPKATWYGVSKNSPRKGAVLKIIKVPTELKTPAQNLRFATFHVPSGSINAQIANWINTKFIAHKPDYFLTPAGQRHPVNLTIPADPNPDQDNPPAP